MAEVSKCLNFDEILENIFSYLSVGDQINCKLVNLKWLYVVMSSSAFINARHLYLTGCAIDSSRPPASLIMNAEYRCVFFFEDLNQKFRRSISNFSSILTKLLQIFKAYIGSRYTKVH